MASACSRFASRRASISSIKSAIRSNTRAAPSFSQPATASTPLRRSFSTRIAPALGCVQSMLPLHSAVAVARMTTRLSITSRSCRALSQELGLSVPR
ncbi:protein NONRESPONDING TO OXYLIPINS 2, mitochondrial isoform X2 [Lotus japonicus]|uniref:protein NONRESPONDING TO OXYLIPINS 2, mitochondrial isoform X2 n=1 Tax=Lotus japonicus TaxID=34305 RepID=UPI0025880DB0|nr:protein NONRESPONDING TO OXYLIPINS 2, mitochondrial isoform X2 [Lotus japonicus]